MVREGYQHKNAPGWRKSKKEKDKEPETIETVDWSFEISNEQLRYITGTLPIRDFSVNQYLKYLPHVCRMDNDSAKAGVIQWHTQGSRLWNKVERFLDVDKKQARRHMMDRNGFLQFLEMHFKKECPTVTWENKMLMIMMTMFLKNVVVLKANLFSTINHDTTKQVLNKLPH